VTIFATLEQHYPAAVEVAARWRSRAAPRQQAESELLRAPAPSARRGATISRQQWTQHRAQHGLSWPVWLSSARSE